MPNCNWRKAAWSLTGNYEWRQQQAVHTHHCALCLWSMNTRPATAWLRSEGRVTASCVMVKRSSPAKSNTNTSPELLETKTTVINRFQHCTDHTHLKLNAVHKIELIYFMKILVSVFLSWRENLANQARLVFYFLTRDCFY